MRLLSTALLANREPPEARRAAERAVKLDASRKAESWLAVARAAVAQGDTVPAKKSLERARELGPKDPAIIGAIGEGYLRLGEPSMARRAFEAAARLDPRAPEWRVGLGVAALESRDSKAALKELQAAEPLAAKADKSVQARLHAALSRAWLAAGKGDLVRADREAKLAVRTDDLCADAHFALARVLEERDGPQARSQLERAVALDGGAPAYRLALAEAWLREGNGAKAAAELSELLRSAPRSAEAAAARKLLADARKKGR